MVQCYHCGEEWTGEARPSYHATCPKCNAYVYVCLNCRFCDPRMASGCALTTTEPVRRKDHPNFCDDFKLADRPAAWSPQTPDPKAASARDKFGRLFKKP
jgi:hypothetical protein